MALINIEYGSLASSDIMNKNFLYLDDKIADNNNTVSTSISSILSNIATINTRLNDLAESLSDYVEQFTSSLEEYKTKTKLLVQKSLMVPNWTGCSVLADLTNYTAPSNGFLLLSTINTSEGIININGVDVSLKKRWSSYENCTLAVALPVKKDDLVKTSVSFYQAFFIPVSEISVEDF